MCVCVSKNDQALANLEPWTAVLTLLGLISKMQSNARAWGILHTYNKVDSSSLVGQVYQWSPHWLCSNHGNQALLARVCVCMCVCVCVCVCVCMWWACLQLSVSAHLMCWQIAQTCTYSFTMCTVKQLIKKIIVEIYVDYWTSLFYSFLSLLACVLVYSAF